MSGYPLPPSRDGFSHGARKDNDVDGKRDFCLAYVDYHSNLSWISKVRAHAPRISMRSVGVKLQQLYTSRDIRA